MMNTEPSVVNMGLCTHPEFLAGTEWQVQPLDDSNARFIASNEDTLHSKFSDISSPMKLDWHNLVLEAKDPTHPERMWTLTTLEGFQS